MSLYDSIDDSVLLDYVNYSLAQVLYYALKEAAASEQSSRMTAMDSATKNAGMSKIYLLWQIKNSITISGLMCRHGSSSCDIE